MQENCLTNYKAATHHIMRLYNRGFGWSSFFTYIRLFVTAPYRDLEALVPQEGFIVDLGCGYGIFANLLGTMSLQRKVLGLDLDEYKINHAHKGFHNVEIRLANITKITIPPADCILLIHVLHHLNNYKEQEELLEACLQKLKIGGRLIIAEVDQRPWWKYVLSKLTDLALYFPERPYYRFRERMMELLKILPVQTEAREMHKGTPYSHITYVCTKTSEV